MVKEKELENLFKLTRKSEPRDARVRFVMKELETIYGSKLRKSKTFKKWREKKIGW